MLKLSIITINRNNAAGLRKTIESVVSQTFSDFEYIVIDGASTDESVNIINEYAHKIDYWISEPDKGIYNAMNKGILKAKGEYLLFLNSGDWLSNSESLNLYSDNLSENYDFIYGDLRIKDNDIEYIKTYPQHLSFKYFISETLPHPATLIKKNVFTKFEMYSENLKICSDWLLFTKAICLYNCTYCHIAKEISTFNLDGLSSKMENQSIVDYEKEISLNLYFANFYTDYKRLEFLENFRNRVLDSIIIKMIKKTGLLKRIKYD